jgi:hypothetical protein
MSELLGTSLPVFIGVTLILTGGAAYMTGQALGATWRPVWQVVAYALLLGCADRFITFALFDGILVSLSGYVIDTAVIAAIALFAFRVTRVHKMVSQYPWLYEKAGPFAWRDKG